MLPHKLSLSPAEKMARALDPILIARDAGIKNLHAEQIRILKNWRMDAMLCWGRQLGKTEVLSIRLAHDLLTNVSAVAIVAARAGRQSYECFKRTRQLLKKIPYCPEFLIDNVDEIELVGGNRLLAFPGSSSDTIRGVAGVTLAALDEATLMERDTRDSISPMCAVRGAPIICAGTAQGESGWFWEQWQDQSINDFTLKSRLTVDQVSHISRDFIEREKKRMPSYEFRREYMAEFLEDGESQLIDRATVMRAICPDPEVRALW